MSQNGTQHICANMYDPDDSVFTGNQSSTWGILSQSGGVTSGMISGSGGCVDFTPTVAGTAVVGFYDAYNILGQTGTITINASTGTKSQLMMMGVGKP